jgi:hypothetical protein
LSGCESRLDAAARELSANLEMSALFPQKRWFHRRISARQQALSPDAGPPRQIDSHSRKKSEPEPHPFIIPRSNNCRTRQILPPGSLFFPLPCQACRVRSTTPARHRSGAGHPYFCLRCSAAIPGAWKCRAVALISTERSVPMRSQQKVRRETPPRGRKICVDLWLSRTF